MSRVVAGGGQAGLVYWALAGMQGWNRTPVLPSGQPTLSHHISSSPVSWNSRGLWICTVGEHRDTSPVCVCMYVFVCACSWLVKPDWLNKQISSCSDLGRRCGVRCLGQAPDRASVFIKWQPSVADSHWNVGVFRINEDRWLIPQRPAPRNKKAEGWTNKNPKAQQPTSIREAEEWEMLLLVQK